MNKMSWKKELKNEFSRKILIKTILGPTHFLFTMSIFSTLLCGFQNCSQVNFNSSTSGFALQARAPEPSAGAVVNQDSDPNASDTSKQTGSQSRQLTSVPQPISIVYKTCASRVMQFHLPQKLVGAGDLRTAYCEGMVNFAPIRPADAPSWSQTYNETIGVQYMEPVPGSPSDWRVGGPSHVNGSTDLVWLQNLSYNDVKLYQSFRIGPHHAGTLVYSDGIRMTNYCTVLASCYDDVATVAGMTW